MRIVTNLNEITSAQPCAIALGFFDGVHIGHRAVVSEAVNNGRGLLPAVFTFYEHPRGDVPLITDRDTRFALLGELGARVIYAPHFESLSALPAEEFFKLLVTKLNAKILAFGENYRFGKGGAGDGALLERLCGETGIECRCRKTISIGENRVNSTAIRQLLEQGDMPAAAKMLGRPYSFCEPVIHGKNLGHELGFATINQELSEGLLQPRKGVYCGYCVLGGVRFPTVTNYGSRPTAGQYAIAAETHIVGFEGDLYDREVTVYLTKYLRPQVKFDSLQALCEQIKHDVAEAKKQ